MEGFSKIALPLTALTQNEKKFEWNEECERSFPELKETLTNVPILAIPEGMEGFMIYNDASKMGLGEVLMQHDKVIAYVINRSLLNTQD